MKKQQRKQEAEGGTRVVVLGGAGAMGRITIRDLFETAPRDWRIVIADYNEEAAVRLARSYKSPRVTGVAADATDVRATARLLKGAFAVINAVQYQHNVAVMRAALAAGAHYMDLGGLFHVTRQQLKLHAEFRRSGLLAILGMGAAPGIVNLLARSVADELDSVEEIRILVGSVDRTPGRTPTALGTSYSIQTVLEESTLPAAVFTRGRFRFVEPMSGAIEVRFPEPVGLCRPAYTIHSEVATLPLTYAKKGIKEVSFRIAFGEDLDGKLRFLRALGLSSDEPVKLGRTAVVPRELLLLLLKQLPAPPAPRKTPPPPPEEYEVLRAVVRGAREGRSMEEIVDCHVPGIRAWGLGIDVDTGCPPSIAVQMLARGEITARGALPPERAVPVEPFFRELAARGMSVERARSYP
jgi:saccharopine dehydrogenase-like NADP-dependent oxidoreductase